MYCFALIYYDYIDSSAIFQVSALCTLELPIKSLLMTEHVEQPVCHMATKKLVYAFIAQVKPSLKCNKSQSVAARSILVRNWFSAQGGDWRAFAKGGFS